MLDKIQTITFTVRSGIIVDYAFAMAVELARILPIDLRQVSFIHNDKEFKIYLKEVDSPK